MRSVNCKYVLVYAWALQKCKLSFLGEWKLSKKFTLGANFVSRKWLYHYTSSQFQFCNTKALLLQVVLFCFCPNIINHDYIIIIIIIIIVALTKGILFPRSLLSMILFYRKLPKCEECSQVGIIIFLASFFLFPSPRAIKFNILFFKT